MLLSIKDSKSSQFENILFYENKFSNNKKKYNYNIIQFSRENNKHFHQQE